MKFTGNRDIAVGVKNIENAKKFYENTLGFKPGKAEPGRRVYNTGNFILYVVEGEPHPPVPSFTVESISEAKKWLEEQDCIILVERERSLYFRDPMGNVWDIIEKSS